jgi:hypothetical protein
METIAWAIFAIIRAQNYLLLVDVEINVLGWKFRLLFKHNRRMDTCRAWIVYFLLNTHKIKKLWFVVYSIYLHKYATKVERMFRVWLTPNILGDRSVIMICKCLILVQCPCSYTKCILQTTKFYMYSEFLPYVFFTGRNVRFISNKEVNYMTWHCRPVFTILNTVISRYTRG